MKRELVENLARELGAFLIYLEKGKIEAQQMDLVTFANVIETHTRNLVLRDVSALLSQYDEEADEHPTHSQVLDMIRYRELV